MKSFITIAAFALLASLSYAAPVTDAEMVDKGYVWQCWPKTCKDR